MNVDLEAEAEVDDVVNPSARGAMAGGAAGAMGAKAGETGAARHVQVNVAPARNLPTAAGIVCAPGLPPMPFPVLLTARAGAQVHLAMRDEALADHGLRVGVTGGGCSGLQYMLDFCRAPTDADLSMQQHGLSVMIDPFSAAHLAGTVIDYVDELSEAGFKFENPNVVRACGCGSSFQT